MPASCVRVCVRMAVSLALSTGITVHLFHTHARTSVGTNTQRHLRTYIDFLTSSSMPSQTRTRAHTHTPICIYQIVGVIINPIVIYSEYEVAHLNKGFKFSSALGLGVSPGFKVQAFGNESHTFIIIPSKYEATSLIRARMCVCMHVRV